MLLAVRPLARGCSVRFLAPAPLGPHSKKLSQIRYNSTEEKPSGKEIQVKSEANHPITNLHLAKKIIKVDKKGSFVADHYLGRFDEQYLIFPEVVRNRKDLQTIKDQFNNVIESYPKIWNNPVQLQKLNFHNLFQMSVSEMMTVFEAIGCSTRQCYETDLTHGYGSQAAHCKIAKSVVSLIIRNCLTYWPIYQSDNERLKAAIPKWSASGFPTDDTGSYPPIGFCWTEQAPGLGSVPPQEWLTFGLQGSSEVNHMTIAGTKTSVLAEEGTQNYLVFYRDKLLSEKHLANPDPQEPNPASDPFVGCVMMHKSELEFGPLYKDFSDLGFYDIKMDNVVGTERLVFPAARKDTTAMNIKALGQVGTCAVTLGILKDSLRRTYAYLIDHKTGLLGCDIIERKLSTVTEKIFAIESMVYYIAGMYDGLEPGFDAHMEATILKIITFELSYECFKELQQVSGSAMFFTSQLQDLINIFDSFLDGNVHNRLYLSTMGIMWYARNHNKTLNELRLAPWYPFAFLREQMHDWAETRDHITLSSDIRGHLHPSLSEAATNLEYVVKRIRWAALTLCRNFGKDVTSAQSELYNFSQMAIDAFLLTAVCSRASKSYCNGSRNADIDVSLATDLSHEVVLRIRLFIERLSRFDSLLSRRSKLINELNVKMGGYYAESPLDPNI